LGLYPGGVTASFSNWQVNDTSTGAFNPVTGEYTAPASGLYLVMLTVNAGLANAATVTSTPLNDASIRLAVDGTPIAESRYPIFDVNVALVLTLRTPLRQATTQITRYVQLNAGERLTTQLSNTYSVPFEAQGSLSVARVE